ncbi:MAG: hypothetical protein KDJ29_04875 [Hyphomicrobiales bacterium]|nr:hypothetical protein [Hyphomicrobiales bacterium]
MLARIGLGAACAVLTGILALQPARADWLGDRLGERLGDKFGERLKAIARTIGAVPAKRIHAAAPRRSHRPGRQSQRNRKKSSLGKLGHVTRSARISIDQTLSYAASGLVGVESVVSAFGAGATAIPRSLRADVPRRTMAPALAAAIRAARHHHYPNSRPLPARVIAVLSKTIPMSAPKRARYVRGGMAMSLPDLVNGAQKLLAGNDHAMVVDDVIVFSSMPGATTVADIQWWAHEVHHVYQYQIWGVDQFAVNYVKNSARIEKRARQVAARAATAYRRAEADRDRTRLSYR